MVLWEENSQMLSVGFVWYLREKTGIFVECAEKSLRGGLEGAWKRLGSRFVACAGAKTFSLNCRG